MDSGIVFPRFRYHPDPLGSGSVVESTAACRCCGQQRGYLYAGPAYAEEDLEDALCPWCIADGSAHRMFGVTFVDCEAFGDAPERAVREISERTPGYHAWQGERWPSCCGDATAFLGPAGIQEIRERYREIEGTILGHIVHDLGISGAGALRLLEALDRDARPTAFLFHCLHCPEYRVHIDRG
jgi:uncharacterized protein CbrC (UPF0167 family)